MGAVKPLDKEITHYLEQLNTRQKKAVLTVVKTFAEEKEPEYDHWKDPGFVAEMDKRFAELERGKVKGHTWDEVKQKARQSIKAKKKK